MLNWFLWKIKKPKLLNKSKHRMKSRPPILPNAPRSIQKGVPLKDLINPESISCLALNIQFVKPDFESEAFCQVAIEDLEPLSVMQRGLHLAKALHQYLPQKYEEALGVLLASFTEEDTEAEEFGLAEFFYLPHSFYISEFGLDPQFNEGDDPFACSMQAMHELTRRFTAEFAIRNFLLSQPERTLQQIMAWMTEPNPRVRRLCSEGTRPKLPWGKGIPAFVADPSPVLPILEGLKDDPSLYVRRSVANHMGDIAKDHPDLIFDLCESWLEQKASAELKWVIRHAIRYWAKKEHGRALLIRMKTKEP